MSDTPSDRRGWWEKDHVYRPAEQSDRLSEPGADRHEEPIPPPAFTPCWRCGKGCEEGSRFCPYCRARLAPDAPHGHARPSAGAPVLHMIGFFSAMLLVSVVHFFVLHSSGNLTQEERFRGLAIAEVIDTILVLFAVACIRGVKPSPAIPPGRKATAWLAGVPVLAALLGLNFAYTHLLRRAFPLLAGDPDIPLNALTVALICVQPAVVEELFFRYLALGVLRSHLGLHGAVLVSSVMFGVAHLGQPLGIPLLIVLGMGLGYMRHASGGLLLPMLMHFTHNLVVLLVNT